jgi:hypothetical protein
MNSIKRLLANINKVLLVAVVISLSIAAIMSFFFCKVYSDNVIHGASSSLTIAELPKDLSEDKDKDKAIKKIEEVAKASNANFYLPVANDSVISNETTVYSFIGNQTLYDENLTNSVYKSFDPEITYKMLPTNKIGSYNLLGTYFTTAQGDQLNVAVTSFRNVGFTVNDVNDFSGQGIMFFVSSLISNNTLLLLISTLIAMFFALSYFAIRRGKLYSLLITNGFSKSKIAMSEVMSILSMFVFSFALVSIGSFFALSVYNNLNYFWDFYSQFIVESLFLFIITVALFLILFYSTTKSIKFIDYIKGKQRITLISAMSIFSQAVVWMLLFSLGASAPANMSVINKNIANLPAYTKIANFDTASMKADKLTTENIDKIGVLIRALDSQNKVLIAWRNRQNLEDSNKVVVQSGEKYGPSNTLIVNNLFLDKQPVYAEDGKQIKPKDFNSEKLYLLVPEKLKGNTDSIKSATQKYVESENDASKLKTYTPKSVELIYTKDNQTVSNFNDGSDFNYGALGLPSMTQVDPIILAVPKSSEFFSSTSYVTFTLHASALFSSDLGLAQLLASSKVDDCFTSIDNVLATAKMQTAQAKVQENMILLGLLVSIIVLILSTFILVLSYTSSSRQAIFGKYANGYSFRRTHWEFLLFLTSMPVLSFVIMLLITQRFDLLSSLYSLGFAMANVAVSTLFIYIKQRNIRSDYIKRY